MRLKTERFVIIISPLFFAVITALLTFSADMTVITALASSILHECGHLIMLLSFNCEIKSITLSFYGMRILRQGEIKLGLKKEIAVCLAGVTVNFFLFVAFLLLYILFKNQLLLKISAVNLILGAFNSLPVFYLDGGRALLGVLECRYDVDRSEKILRIVSFSVLVPILVFGIILYLKSGNFTLLICCVYILFSSFAK